MPIAETMNPPPKHSAATNIDLRGPTRSTQRPNSAADEPEDRDRDRKRPAHVGQLPIARRRMRDADQLGQRQIEGREGVRLADRQVHRQGGRRHHEAVVIRAARSCFPCSRKDAGMRRSSGQCLFLMRDNMRQRPSTCHYDVRHNPASCTGHLARPQSGASGRLRNRDTRGRLERRRRRNFGRLMHISRHAGRHASTRRRDSWWWPSCCWLPRGSLPPLRRPASPIPTRRFSGLQDLIGQDANAGAQQAQSRS